MYINFLKIILQDNMEKWIKNEWHYTLFKFPKLFSMINFQFSLHITKTKKCKSSRSSRLGKTKTGHYNLFNGYFFANLPPKRRFFTVCIEFAFFKNYLFFQKVYLKKEWWIFQVFLKKLDVLKYNVLYVVLCSVYPLNNTLLIFFKRMTGWKVRMILVKTFFYLSYFLIVPT